MILLLAFAASYRENQCVSMLQHGPPIKNGTLLQIQVLIRHGARAGGVQFAPSEGNEWHCDEFDSESPRINPAPFIQPRNYHDSFDQRLLTYKPSCREKDLTIEGMNQHYELGQMYRKYLVEENKLLPKELDPDLIFARATEKDRTMRSAISFLQGLYHSKSPNEIINVMTDNKAAGILHPSAGWCKALKNQVKDFYSSNDFMKNVWNTSRYQKYSTLFQKYNQDFNPKAFKQFCSWVVIFHCTKHNLPSFITDENIDDAINFMAQYHYGVNDNNKYRGLASAPLFREMFSLAEKFLSGEVNQKFVLLSSHDTALSAYLVTLGQKFDAAPPLRSHLALELWEYGSSIYSRYVYNGEVLTIPFMNNQSFYRYTDLKTKMSLLGYLSPCQVPEWRKY